MNLAITSIAVAAVLPIVCGGLAKRSGILDRSFDNHDPRGWLARQTGSSARANAAQQNSWEALAIFAPAVLAAEHSLCSAGDCANLGASQGRIDAIAGAFIVARILYIALYIADVPRGRSLVWTVGLMLSLSLFFVHHV